MAKLILVRHGATDYNEKGLWTGWIDAATSKAGRGEVQAAAHLIADEKVEAVFTSDLIRAVETWAIIAATLKWPLGQPTAASELRERDYGDLSGQNKWRVRKQYGFKQWLAWRRDWDAAVPNGENLKMVYERVVPYYKSQILPLLKQGRNVLIAAHGNSLRTLVKYLENLSVRQVERLEIATGGVYVYELNKAGKVVAKEIRGRRRNRY